MKVSQQYWNSGDGFSAPSSALSDAHLVLLFGARSALENSGLVNAVREGYPGAICIGCSTAGEIFDSWVMDDSLTVTAVNFDTTRVRLARAEVLHAPDSAAAGRRLAAELAAQDLVHVFVLSDGLSVNGSELVSGLRESLPPAVGITGGLAGDGVSFQTTLVCANAAPASGGVAAVGFYGDDLVVGHGSLGGWDAFGPERVITRAQGNILYELDGQSALGLYKSYLGEHANELPASALLFPLELRLEESGCGLVRTILNVSEAEQSMTFAGDMPVGARVKLMKANFDRLVEGAEGAARHSQKAFGHTPVDLAILISCVGRKLVLNQRIDDEVEAVRSVLGEQAVITGFYSYGEISPFTPTARCELHNQTMTITTFAER
jgi:hypothetical protein